MSENDTIPLRRAFYISLNAGDWSPKTTIKHAAGGVAFAMENWKHLNSSLYYDAIELHDTRSNEMRNLVCRADKLKLELFKFINQLEGRED
jgi:hypothetical protein